MFRARFLKQLAACVLGMLVLVGTAAAQVRNFDIPKGDLQSALDAYAQQTGLQVIYRSEDVHGVMTAGAHGALDANAALQDLLAKTGFHVIRESNGAIAIVKAAPPKTSDTGRSGDAGKTLETIKVTGKVQGYSATRVPTELREIPQSVSVISQELLEQQNGYDLTGALNWATGISLVQAGTIGSAFYSRGFAVDGYHVDGGAQLLFKAGSWIDDMSEYDRVEVLRGADGLFGGANDPGATVNLVRKQPLATNQVDLSGTLGSWDYYRLGLDATGPLGFDGKLRGRVVVSNTEQDYFYDAANRKEHKLYGVLAYDLSHSTTLTVGGSVEQSDWTGTSTGLPRYTTGADAHLPRSQGLVFPQDYDRAHTTEAFVQLDQDFGGGWKLKASVTRSRAEDNSTDWELPYSGIDPATGLIEGMPSVSSGGDAAPQTSAAATLTGGFDWNGRRQDVTIGMDYARTHVDYLSAEPVVAGPPALNPWQFDPAAYTVEPASQTNPVFWLDAEGTFKTAGVYAALRLRPWNKWSITLGARDNYQRTTSSFSMGMDSGSGANWFPPVQIPTSVPGS